MSVKMSTTLLSLSSRISFATWMYCCLAVEAKTSGYPPLFFGVWVDMMRVGGMGVCGRWNMGRRGQNGIWKWNEIWVKKQISVGMEVWKVEGGKRKDVADTESVSES